MEELTITSNRDRKHHIWVEKYRPKVLSEYIGNESIKETFQKYIDQQDLNNILLYGPPGTGKTTAAKILTKSIKCDSIYINASDERTLEVVRDKITSFASSCGFNSLKVIICDEFDGFPAMSQRTLRGTIETYSLHTRFILTANYHERIIDPILSRVQSFEVKPPNKKEAAKHLVDILKAENITFTNENMAMIVNTYYPDIRKIIQFAQQSSINGTLTIAKSNLIEHDIRNKIVEMLKVRSPFLEIRKFVMDQGLKRFEEIYQYLYENVDTYAEGKQSSVILKLAESIVSDSMVANKEITFLACIIEILKTLKS